MAPPSELARLTCYREDLPALERVIALLDARWRAHLAIDDESGARGLRELRTMFGTYRDHLSKIVEQLDGLPLHLLEGREGDGVA